MRKSPFCTPISTISGGEKAYIGTWNGPFRNAIKPILESRDKGFTSHITLNSLIISNLSIFSENSRNFRQKPFRPQKREKSGGFSPLFLTHAPPNEHANYRYLTAGAQRYTHHLYIQCVKQQPFPLCHFVIKYMSFCHQLTQGTHFVFTESGKH